MSEEPEVLGGRYELGRLLGSGGMADVHLATDTRLHRTVAVKTLRPDLARDDTFQERFRREAQSAAGLNHPAIVAVYDTGEEQETDRRGRTITIPYIVMEHVEGRTLREFVSEGHPMQPRQAAEIMAGVLSALEYSHRMGIVHRDIKPGNVMITDSGEVKVMDFGIARAVADASSAMTQTQAVMGTAQYLSPEQARGQLVDARSDIYSAACVLYELVTGRTPFVGDSPVSIAYQHVREEPAAPSQLNPELSPAWDAVILTGLAKDRDERYPSAVAFSRDIAAVVAGREPRLVGDATVDAERTVALSPSVNEAGTVLLPAVTAGAANAPRPLPPSLSDPTPSSAPATESVEPSRRRGPGLLIALVVMALSGIALAALLYLHPWSKTPAGMSVPDLVGRTSAQAKQALTEQGLRVRIVQESSGTVPKDSVISTDPAAGAKIQPGGTVTVNVSTGPERLSVPDVTGKSREEAEKILTDAKLKMSVKGTENSSTMQKDQVTRMSPGAGTTVAVGQTIEVYLSTGKVQVPDVTGQNQEAASTALTDAGLTVEVSEKVSTTDEPGTVLSQSVPPNSTADLGSTVQIVVAKEQGPITIPNFTGHPAEQAQKDLQGLGFGVTQTQDFSDSVPAGSVIRSDPEAGQAVKPGSTVTIVISKGAQPQPSASPTPSSTAPPKPAPSPSKPADGGEASPGGAGGSDRGLRNA